MSLTNNQKFWLIQLSIWGGFSLINIITRSTLLGFQPFELANALALLLALLVASGWMRSFYQNKNETKIGSSFLYALSGSVAASIVANIVIALILYPAQMLLFEQILPQSHLQILAVWPTLFLFTFCWSMTYLLIKRHRTLKQIQLEKAELDTQLHHAQMELMLNQLNPHFVFNAINNIRALILENPNKARDSLTSLSEVLRSLLAVEAESEWTLDEELSLCHGFINLCKLQYEQRLQVEENIRGDTQSWIVPRMLLQLIIENAIKHGIAQRPSGGNIQINIEAQTDSLLIEVTNPGVLNDLRGGVGLRNIRTRLALLYPSRHVIQLKQVDSMVVATIRITNKE
ncbi:TPA: histidine kinase [Vibrio vulnificus]|uniref:sensor histidine kinase n=1 Tax=Vibrio vulnificus TaxID=672 RepID=UPI001A345065|nr:histidine kinase [Vibrio vulnificus]MCA4022029.1 histidine kinase [Vibrio vulnificus]HAT8484651.1 hypothetical protein [Vibrio vulnificus]HDY7458749.1 histidine kinase [Vibrio vulnificus]HDY8208663.1 histidine kinase [Vibrio vulnificus]